MYPLPQTVNKITGIVLYCITVGSLVVLSTRQSTKEDVATVQENHLNMHSSALIGSLSVQKRISSHKRTSKLLLASTRMPKTEERTDHMYTNSAEAVWIDPLEYVSNQEGLPSDM